MSTKEELACVYAALLLQDDGVSVTGDKIQSVLKAAGVEIDPFWPGLFAKALEGVDVKNLITNVTSGVGVAAPSGAASSGGAPAGGKAEAKEEKKEPEKKKEEPKEESDEDMGFGLFD